jgi:hypothetical protein
MTPPTPPDSSDQGPDEASPERSDSMDEADVVNGEGDPGEGPADTE